MNIYEDGNKIILENPSDFEPERIFECGQCFRWDRNADGSYTGVVGRKCATVGKTGNDIYITGTLEDYNSVWHQYFDMDTDYAAVRKAVSVDEFMRQAAEYGTGIRILKQEMWEALCSFIISQCNNITRIKGIVYRLCREFGEHAECDGDYYAFPSAERVAALSEDDLACLRAGYRVPYILNAARKVASGEFNLTDVSVLPQREMLSELMSLTGVGKKVANCMMLFGFHRLDSFPIDVWIKRVIDENYGSGFSPEIFGEYAGVAQQYMFYYARETSKNGERK